MICLFIIENWQELGSWLFIIENWQELGSWLFIDSQILDKEPDDLTSINTIREYLITDSADHMGGRSTFGLVRPIISGAAQTS